MAEKIIVTIGREYGSGGHDVGKRLAKKLGIKFYDNELINIAAKEMGFHEDYIRSNEEKAPGFSAFIGSGGAISALPSNDIQQAEFELIRKIAETESCVIVGRAADFILEDVQHASIFVFAPREERLKRIKLNSAVYDKTFPEEPKTDADYEKILKTTDKQRKKFYEYYTDKKWGSRDSYDILIDTHKTGIDGAVAIIETYLKSSKDKDLFSDIK